MSNNEQKPIFIAPLGRHRVYRARNSSYRRDGLKSYVHALLKYNISPTKDGPFFTYHRVHGDGLSRVLMKKVDHYHHFTQHTSTDVATVEASDVQHDVEYLCPVTIGSPGQTLMLDFDTGSADLWCWSTKLNNSLVHHYQKTHTIYDPGRSFTSRIKDGFTWEIRYGDGSSASGNIYQDNIEIGGMVVRGQAVETAKHLSRAFEKGFEDGLLGLAFGAINTAKPHRVLTPVERMIKQEDIPTEAQLFTAWLGSYKDADEDDHGRSFYTFGFIDKDALRSAGVFDNTGIWYTDIDTHNGFWQFPSTKAAVNGSEIELASNTAIADTGTTLALLSDDMCRFIYNAIPGAKYENSVQGYIFPKTVTVDELPVIELDVGGKLFTVQKEDLVFADAGYGMVYGGIQSRGNLPFDIFGDTFLKAIYAIFDQGRKRFGAVQRIEHHQNLST